MGVLGIGGMFFRSRDPEGLLAWYREHLGVGLGEYGSWQQQAGETIFQPFPADTDYFPADRQFMLNFRVSGLDDLVEGLRARGVEVRTNPEWNVPGVGRFAQLLDPEGNALELWEPDASDASGDGDATDAAGGAGQA